MEDLKLRLERTRLPESAPGKPWDHGVDIGWLDKLIAYWRDGFDWRIQEADLNTSPQYRSEMRGIPLHFLHIPGKGPDPMPLLLCHGWPGSVYEFLDMIPLAHRSFTIRGRSARRIYCGRPLIAGIWCVLSPWATTALHC